MIDDERLSAVRMTPLEREEKWARWPQGDGGDAIDFACDHAKEPLSFLEDWRAGRADEWPEYMRWLKVQRDCARRSGEQSMAHDEERKAMTDAKKETLYGLSFPKPSPRNEVQEKWLELCGANARRSGVPREAAPYPPEIIVPWLRGWDGATRDQ